VRSRTCLYELGVKLASAIRICTEQRKHPTRREECRLLHPADRRVVATPSPFARRPHESGANGVEHDVAGQLEQVRVALDELAVKPALEEVASVVVAPVEPLRVHTVQPVHSARDIWFRRLDEKVIVIRHQAIRVASPSQELDDLPEQLEEPEPVAGIGENLLLAVPPRRHVIRGAVSLESRRPGHLPTVAAVGLAARAWHRVGAETARFRLCGTGPGARRQDTPRRDTT
jgi:hypothetical protein